MRKPAAARTESNRARTKTSEVSKFIWIVRHGAHHPIGCRLPHRVQDTAEDVEPHLSNVPAVVDVNFQSVRRDRLAGVVPVAGCEHMFAGRKSARSSYL